MRTASILALLLAACGGSETPATEAADHAAEGADHAAEGADHAAEGADHAAEGAVTCDAFADHMLESMSAQADAAGDNEFMTADQAKEFATAMVDGIRAGCKSNDRLGEFPEVVGCFMEASVEAEWEACKTKPNADQFDEYMKGLLAASIQLEPAAGE